MGSRQFACAVTQGSAGIAYPSELTAAGGFHTLEKQIPRRTVSNDIRIMAKARRTTHRSVAGKKLYAVRDAKGRFKDIQTFERAHRADLAKKSKAEKAK